MNPSKKEISKLFYSVKGHLVDEHNMALCYDSYFKRMWGNHELVYHEDGFEEAYEAYLRKANQ